MDEQELTYRSLSNAAVIGLVLAVLSGLSFFWPTLWPLTLIALFVSWTAARTIRKNEELLAGIKLARLGIFLATAIGVATFVKATTLQKLHQADADLLANQFIQLVLEDDLVGAFELTIPYKERQPTPEHAKIQYDTDLDAIQAFDDFKSYEPILLLEAAESDDVRLAKKNPATSSSYGRYLVSRVYEIQSSKKGLAKKNSTKSILLLLERSSHQSQSPLSWHVKEVRMHTAGL